MHKKRCDVKNEGRKVPYSKNSERKNQEGKEEKEENDEERTMSPSVLALSSVSVSAAAWSQRRRSTLTVIGLVLMLAIEIPIIRCFQQQQYRYRQSSSRTFRPCRSSPSSSFIAFRNTETTKDARVPGYSKTSPKLTLALASSLSSSSSMQPTIHQPPQTQYATYLVTCVPGLAHIVQRELEDIRQMITTAKKKEKNLPEEDVDEEEYAIVDIAVSGNAGVTFEATREGSLYVLCWLRSGHRLLELVAATTTDVEASSLLTSRHDLSTFIRNAVNVKDLLGDGQGGMLTVSVKAILNNPRDLPKDLSHSHYTALTIKNALCDVVRELRQGDRPTVDIDNPDVPLVAILRGVNFYQNYHQDYNNNNNGYAEDHNDEGAASISLYRSLHPPGSLHKRGYRSGSAIHKAAMKESMAAGLLIEAGWKDKVDSVMANYQQRRKNHNKNNDHDDDAEEPQQQQQQRLKLIDPMAGSGSLVIEAAMLASNISPGLMRIRCGVPNHLHPPVTRWKTPLLPDTTTNYDVAAAWKTVLLDATERAKEGMRILKQDPSLIQIVGNDIYPPAVDVFEESLRSAGLLNLVELSNKDCYDLDATSTTTSTLADENTDHDTNNIDYVVATNPPW